jgi:hypothetical protein
VTPNWSGKSPSYIFTPQNARHILFGRKLFNRVRPTKCLCLSLVFAFVCVGLWLFYFPIAHPASFFSHLPINMGKSMTDPTPRQKKTSQTSELPRA